jgi:hypothetical protein
MARTDAREENNPVTVLMTVMAALVASDAESVGAATDEAKQAVMQS